MFLQNTNTSETRVSPGGHDRDMAIESRKTPVVKRQLKKSQLLWTIQSAFLKAMHGPIKVNLIFGVQIKSWTNEE